MVFLMVLQSFPHDSYCKMNIIFSDAHWRLNAQCLDGQEMEGEHGGWVGGEKEKEEEKGRWVGGSKEGGGEEDEVEEENFMGYQINSLSQAYSSIQPSFANKHSIVLAIFPDLTNLHSW